MCEKIYMDGRELKVGDKVWSLLHGWIQYIGNNPRSTYLLKFRHGNVSVNYPKDFAWSCAGSKRLLFWNEVTIDPPAPPKQKVKKWRWVCRYQATQQLTVTAQHYANAAELEREYPCYSAVQAIVSTEITVEE